MKKKVFIAYRYHSESIPELLKEMRLVHDAIEVAGHHHYSTLFDTRMVDNNHEDIITEREIAKLSFEEIDSSDIILFFVKNEELSRGMLMELGYALAKKKRLVLAINKNVRDARLFRDLIDEVIEFDTLEDLKNKLSKEKFDEVRASKF